MYNFNKIEIQFVFHCGVSFLSSIVKNLSVAAFKNIFVVN